MLNTKSLLLGKWVNLSVLTLIMASAMKTIAQDPVNDPILARYSRAYDTLHSILSKDGQFKSAVFISENAFHDDTLSYREYIARINGIAALVKMNKRSSQLSGKLRMDAENYAINYSIFSVFTDSLQMVQDTIRYIHLPFRYDYGDTSGNHNWKNTFVTRLLQENLGNCHSLAYLYKITADELEAKCWLSLAQNHIYIRNYNRQIGWYNTELTSGVFPTDAWMATSGYVSPDAIRSGIYMDTLSNQQSIALCVLDLAKGYGLKTRNCDDGFILKCCDLVLQYHQVNPMALLLKAETLKKLYLKQIAQKQPSAADTYRAMEAIYITLASLHYRQMPEGMYRQWLRSLMSQRTKTCKSS